jgi:hypothetical protein
MAHFYGTIKGGRGEASRLGHKSTGLQATAASYSGAVEVQLYANKDGVDCAIISLIPWKGAGIHRMLFNGPVSGAGLEYSVFIAPAKAKETTS